MSSTHTRKPIKFGSDYCLECSEDGARFVVWPCPTVERDRLSAELREAKTEAQRWERLEGVAERAQARATICAEEALAELERVKAGRAFEQEALSNALTLLVEREDLLAKIEAVRALHQGTHLCVAGAWFTNDPTYRGSIADRKNCPTLVALADVPTDETST